MREIEVTGVVGDKQITLRITKPTGSGEQWYIIIDNFFNGQIIENAWGRTWHLNSKSDLTSDDITILNEIIDHPPPCL